MWLREALLVKLQSEKSERKSGQRKKSTQIGVSFITNLGCAPRNIRNYNLRCEKSDSDYNYKRCETDVGSHISTIIAVVERCNY